MGRHRGNAYYPLVGLELGGALKLRPIYRVVLCSVVFVVLRVLDTVGEILFVVDHFQFLREAVG